MVVDSSNVKKSQRKGRDSSFTKKEKNLLALTDAEQSKDIPKSMDTPKLVKVSKEVFKDILNSMKKSIKNPTTEPKSTQVTRKRIVKKSEDPSLTKKEKNCLN